jgi:hypothetical protein
MSCDAEMLLLMNGKLTIGTVKSTDTQRSASYLDLHLKIDNGGKLKNKTLQQTDDFTVPIVNFPFISSNISASQLIR